MTDKQTKLAPGDQLPPAAQIAHRQLLVAILLPAVARGASITSGNFLDMAFALADQIIEHE